jgi:hypothetical protein
MRAAKDRTLSLLYFRKKHDDVARVLMLMTNDEGREAGGDGGGGDGERVRADAALRFSTKNFN